jgi:hypothetical protein
MTGRYVRAKTSRASSSPAAAPSTSVQQVVCACVNDADYGMTRFFSCENRRPADDRAEDDMTIWLALALLVQEGRPPGPGVVEPPKGDRIQWYATWDLAKEEAERTGRPILLISAAPHCHHISGVW